MDGVSVSVSLVNLLGVRVAARATLNPAEHSRRQRAGLRSVTDPALLGALLQVPLGRPVSDPVLWAETAAQAADVVRREDDGYTVTRLLEPALVLTDVTVPARRGREIPAVQQASLFAGFAARWVTLAAEPRAAVVLEAKLCGVGLADLDGTVILPAEQPRVTADGWAWLLGEKAYRRWLTECPAEHERATPVPATAAASARLAG